MGAKDFLSIRDLSPQKMEYLLFQGRQIKASPSHYRETLAGKTLALIFEKPSLRTQMTFDVGIHQLGGFCIYLSPTEISLGKRESIEDVARNLERMVQGIVIRTFAHEIVEKMSACCGIPVINGLSDFSHPCQAMADYQTIWELKGRLRDVRVTFVGDGNNVAHSLIYGAARLGVRMRIATPAGYEPDRSVVADAKREGGDITLTHDALEAVAGADAVYTDVWISMGQEDEADTRLRVFRPYQVNSELLRNAGPQVLFMHCLPARRGQEVTDEVMDSPRSIVYDQAENRLHIQKAMLAALLS